MPLRPLFGHHPIRTRLAAAAADGRLPASLLLTGPRGVGKQRLALWLGQLLLCDRALPARSGEPCGTCPQCRYALQGAHPDLHWYFPLKLKKGSDSDAADVANEYGDARRERVESGLWAASDGMVGIYIRTINALAHQASLRPSLARRTVFVVGDAERMAAQESNKEPANAFLKLLEEPPPGTTLVLTSSEPGLLLPTIKSRVVTVRVPRLPEGEVEAFLDDPEVARALARIPRDEARQRAAGAPGALFGSSARDAAQQAARQLLEAALLPATPAGMAERALAAARQGMSGARGAFSDTLDALVRLLHARAQHLAEAGEARGARRTATSVLAVEEAIVRAQGNVNPQLLSAHLLATLHRTLVP